MAWQQNQWGQPQPGYGYGQMGGYSQPQSRQQTNVDWIRVPNVQDVEQVTVQAGQTAWIMAQNTSVFAVRMADNMGIVTTKYFRFDAWDPAAAETQRQASIEERLSRLEAMVNGAQSTPGRFESAAIPSDPV